MTAPAEDIPELVALEMVAAQAANIPLIDQPRYVADRIRLRIGGGYEYIRKSSMSPAQLRESIKKEWRGNNVTELSLKWNRSARRIRQIVNGE